METKAENFNEKEALQLIESTIKSAQDKFNENGFVFRFWGWAVLLGEILCFYWSYTKQWEFIGWTWCAIGVTGGVVNGIYFSRREKKLKIKTHIDRIVSYIWGAVGIGGGIFYIFLIVFGPQWLINSLVCMVIGIGTFATGGALKFKPLIIGGLIFFLFSLACLWVKGPVQFLVAGAAMIPGYLIPGYLLKAHSKKMGMDV